MAGVGVKLNRIFKKKSIAASVAGVTYSVVITIAPVLLVTGTILLMGAVLGFNEVDYLKKEIFSGTVMYMFIFGLITVSPFSSVLSKYMQDVIYEERFEDILPCYYTGLVMSTVLGCLMGIPFCVWEHVVGGIGTAYVFCGFCAYISVVFMFYSLSYLAICKDYERVFLFFFAGMGIAFFLCLFLNMRLGRELTESMLFSLAIGLFLIAAMEFAAVKRYFNKNSNRYKPVLGYFKKWWQLVVIKFCYIFGLYVHNFLFWTHETRTVIAGTFVFNESYDMAAYLAMFTNISATVIFISNLEMHFHEKYKNYSESVIGGKKADIENAKDRMFRQLSNELMNLVRMQFIISIIIYLSCVVFLPRFGFAGSVLRIYPCLAVGYFILFMMYAEILFLYYFNDLTGAVITTLGFFAGTFFGTLFAMNLSEIWYGAGLVLGAFIGWSIGYGRLRYVEKNLDVHIFCSGRLLKRGDGPKPSGLVYRKHCPGENEA
ncbi:exopolysaccharide Pel transporter PelG [Lachnospiraceae bacterium 45-P1]